MSVFKCFKCQKNTLKGKKRKECTVEIDGINLEKRMINCPLIMSDDPNRTIEASWELVE